MKKFTVFGNPIAQSKSPQLQMFFAQQMQKNMQYTAILGDLEIFEQQLTQFFQQGGYGCNVTAPFKQRAFLFADQHSDRAKQAQAANTLYLLNNQIYADNTDGIGLVADLNRLGWLTTKQTILILGAGGATQGILSSLLAQQQNIVLANRTLTNLDRFVDLFTDAKAHIQTCSLTNIPNQDYAIIINTIPNYNWQTPLLPNNLFSTCQAIYDLSYFPKDNTNFINYAIQASVQNYADGKGMLIYQGAFAFNLWWNCQIPTNIINDAFKLLSNSVG